MAQIAQSEKIELLVKLTKKLWFTADKKLRIKNIIH